MLKSIKSFVISFLISSVILGIAAAVLMGKLEDVITGSFNRSDREISDILNSETDDGLNDNGEVSVTNALSGIEGSSFTVLAVMTDYRPDVYDYNLTSTDASVGLFQNGVKRYGAAKICIIKCSKETGRFIFLPISPLTRVNTTAGYERLYDVYTDYGIDYLKAKLEAVTGLTIDRYAVINCYGMSYFTNTVGAVWCTVPCDIYTNGKEYVSEAAAKAATKKDPEDKYSLFLEKCEDYIGPSSMGLLLFSDYSNGIEDELSVSSGYMKGIMKNLAKFPVELLGGYWENIKAGLTFTDIDAAFINEHSKLIVAYNDNLTKTVKAIGVFRTSGNDGQPYFDLDQTRTVDNLESYR